METAYQFRNGEVLIATYDGEIHLDEWRMDDIPDEYCGWFTWQGEKIPYDLRSGTIGKVESTRRGAPISGAKYNGNLQAARRAKQQEWTRAGKGKIDFGDSVDYTKPASNSEKRHNKQWTSGKKTQFKGKTKQNLASKKDGDTFSFGKFTATKVGDKWKLNGKKISEKELIEKAWEVNEKNPEALSKTEQKEIKEQAKENSQKGIQDKIPTETTEGKETKAVKENNKTTEQHKNNGESVIKPFVKPTEQRASVSEESDKLAHSLNHNKSTDKPISKSTSKSPANDIEATNNEEGTDYASLLKDVDKSSLRDQQSYLNNSTSKQEDRPTITHENTVDLKNSAHSTFELGDEKWTMSVMANENGKYELTARNQYGNNLEKTTYDSKEEAVKVMKNAKKAIADDYNARKSERDAESIRKQVAEGSKVANLRRTELLKQGRGWSRGEGDTQALANRNGKTQKPAETPQAKPSSVPKTTTPASTISVPNTKPTPLSEPEETGMGEKELKTLQTDVKIDKLKDRAQKAIKSINEALTKHDRKLEDIDPSKDNAKELREKAKKDTERKIEDIMNSYNADVDPILAESHKQAQEKRQKEADRQARIKDLKSQGYTDQDIKELESYEKILNEPAPKKESKKAKEQRMQAQSSAKSAIASLESKVSKKNKDNETKAWKESHKAESEQKFGSEIDALSPQELEKQYLASLGKKAQDENERMRNMVLSDRYNKKLQSGEIQKAREENKQKAEQQKAEQQNIEPKSLADIRRENAKDNPARQEDVMWAEMNYSNETNNAVNEFNSTTNNDKKREVLNGIGNGERIKAKYTETNGGRMNSFYTILTKQGDHWVDEDNNVYQADDIIGARLER